MSGGAVNEHKERTARFAEEVVRFLRTVRLTASGELVVKQFVRSSTVVGAHYCEADDAGRRNGLRYPLSLAVPESLETKRGRSSLVAAVPEKAPAIRRIYSESDEVSRIFKAVHRKTSSCD